MTTAAFLLLLCLYMYACYLGARGYFLVAGYLRSTLRNVVIRATLMYLWFIAFVVVEVPVGVFFPAWASERLMVFTRSPATTAILIVFGCVILASAIWMGWRKAGAKRLMEAQPR